jgi:hypothetical protein
MWIFAAVAVCCSVLAACASPSGQTSAAAQSGALDQPFTLKPGEQRSINSGGIAVRFEGVASDSRCPRDVQCITAGEAVVRVTATLPGRPAQQIELRTTPAGSSAAAGDFTLTLTDLQPVPVSTQETRASDYRATFVVSKRP